MARLPYLDAKDVAPENQDLLRGAQNLSRTMIHSPGAARSLGVVARFIRHQSRLDPRLREMAILQVGYLAKAPYEYSHHVKLGMVDFGVSESDLRAIADETAGRETSLDPLTKAVLRAAREITTNLSPSDATFAILREHLEPELIVDLTVAISFYNGIVRILTTLQVDVEDDFKQYLEKFPLPKS